MKNKLTAAILEQIGPNERTYKTVTVLNEYEVRIQEEVRESQLDKVIFDYLNLFEQASKTGEMDDEFIRGMGPLLHTLMIREFTDIPGIPHGNTVEELLPYAIALYDAGIKKPGDVGLMAEILNHFDSENMKRIYDKLARSGEQIGQTLGEEVIRKSLASEPTQTHG